MSEEDNKNTTEEKSSGLFSGLKRGLAKTRESLAAGFDNVIHGKAVVGPELMAQIEESLLIADVGMAATQDIMDELNREVGAERLRTPKAVQDHLKQLMAGQLNANQNVWESTDSTPHVILVIGVNGSGKTTTIGKLAAKFHSEGKNVVLAAGDTFRAAAIDQLKIWGERTGSNVVARNIGSDAAGLVYDALAQARDEGADVLLIDTAGRLQNKEGLMEELVKVNRVLRKLDPSAPHDVLLVLDATTGQNALSQVDVFRERAGVTGLVMTKLDGTARGGILVAISAKHGLPVHAIGVGEGVDDLQPFDAGEFAQAIAAG